MSTLKKWVPCGFKQEALPQGVSRWEVSMGMIRSVFALKDDDAHF
jgi:hypothetical protein